MEYKYSLIFIPDKPRKVFVQKKGLLQLLPFSSIIDHDEQKCGSKNSHLIISTMCLFAMVMYSFGSQAMFVMDNHRSAAWCWLQACHPEQEYNFMHIDRHYDLLDCFEDRDLQPLFSNSKIPFADFCNLSRSDGEFRVFRWDNYIMASSIINPGWFHTNIFLTHKEGDKECSWGHKSLMIREEDPLSIEWCMQQFIGEPSRDLDGFEGEDYRNSWIVNLDLDFFFSGNSHIQLFSDDLIRQIAEILQRNLSNIAVLTIALSPDCLGGKDHKERWEKGFRILRIMSERIECLRLFSDDVKRTIQV